MACDVCAQVVVMCDSLLHGCEVHGMSLIGRGCYEGKRSKLAANQRRGGDLAHEPIQNTNRGKRTHKVAKWRQRKAFGSCDSDARRLAGLQPALAVQIGFDSSDDGVGSVAFLCFHIVRYMRL